VPVARFLLTALLLCLFLAPPLSADQRLKVHFFTADNCPACAAVHPLVLDVAATNPGVVLCEYQVWRNRPNREVLMSLVEFYGEPLGTPALFVGDRYWIGFNKSHRAEIERTIERCLLDGCVDPLDRLAGVEQGGEEQVQVVEQTFTVPLLGEIEGKETSLPLLTLTLGLLDSINPCAFFVLLFLLGLLVNAHSHIRMLVIGGVFVFFSGLIYFLFMAAWLNLFLVVGGVQVVTLFAGLVALIVAVLNIKDFFRFKQGASLSMSDAQRGHLAQRIRSLVYASRFPVMIFGTILLAIAANSYELLCTAGFPMVFTRVLTMHELPVTAFYLYLVAYNVVYILPLLAIVVTFSLTLGRHQLSEWQGRELKLVSGVMMLALGLALVFAPRLLNSVAGAAAILGGALAGSALIIVFYKAKHPEVVAGLSGKSSHH